jgi:hypothetical protein
MHRRQPLAAPPPPAGDARIQQSVARMQTVIELGRTIRERRNKPLKMPLTELVVVHTDKDFLADIEGGWCWAVLGWTGMWCCVC